MFFDISLNRRFIVFKSKFSTNSHNSLYLSWFDSLKLDGVNIKILLLYITLPNLESYIAAIIPKLLINGDIIDKIDNIA